VRQFGDYLLELHRDARFSEYRISGCLYVDMGPFGSQWTDLREI